MMKYTIISFSLAILFSCNQSENHPTEIIGLKETTDTAKYESKGYTEHSDVISETNIESINLEEFWATKILPIINNENVRSKNIFHFPLQGDWGLMMELNKPDSLWTEKDFFDNYEKVFTKEVREKLKMQNQNDVEVYTNMKGFSELLIGIGWETWIDGFKDESGIIFRFRKINNQWKMYVIHGVG